MPRPFVPTELAGALAGQAADAVVPGWPGNADSVAVGVLAHAFEGGSPCYAYIATVRE